MTPRELDFADSFESSAAPTAGFTVASSIKSFVDDAAFVTAKGSAASAGDIYHNTTSNQVREYNGSAWREIVASEGAQTIAGDKTFSGSMVIIGDLTVNGTTTTINTQTLDVEDAQITVNKGGTQATANAQDAGLLVEMSDATDVMIGYDSTLASRFKAGDVGSEAEVATVSHTQTLTNKTIDADQNTITNIENADIKAGAAIERSKIANGTADHVVINSAGGAFSSEANLSISRGGTGAGSATAGFNALSPVTTKGDIITRDVTNNIRLAVGTDGQVLTADSLEASGIKWATLSGSANWTVTSVQTGSYTAATGELVRIDQSGGTFTTTLPTAVGKGGQRIKLVQTGTSWNIAGTIDADGTETIGGALTIALYTPGESYELVSDNANWIIDVHNIPSNMSTAAVHTPGAVTTAPTEPVNATHNTYYYWRDGRFLEIVHDYRVSTASGGTNGTGAYLWTLPQSLTKSADVKASTGTAGTGFYDGYSNIGDGIAYNSATVNNAAVYALMYDSTRFMLLNRSGNAAIGSAHIGWVNAGGTIGYSIKVRVKIDGWLG